MCIRDRLVIALVVTLLLRYLKRMPKKQADHIIQIAAIVLPLVELIRVLWLIMVGQTDWVRLLPLQLCGTQIFYIPLAVFTKNMAIKEFTCSTAVSYTHLDVYKRQLLRVSVMPVLK